MGVFGAVFGSLAFLAVIAGVVYLAALVVRGQSERVSTFFHFRNLVRFYAYIASIAGLIVLIIGLANFLKVGFSYADYEFSYYRYEPAPVRQPIDGPAIKPVEAREPDYRRNDLIDASTFTAIGLLVLAVHTVLRRVLARGLDLAHDATERIYVFAMLVSFGIASIALMANALRDLLRYLLNADTFRPQPGEAVATMAIVLPIWLYYALRTWAMMRKPEQ